MKEGNKVICVGYEVKSSAELSDPIPREDRVGTPDEARPAQPGRLRDGAYGYTQATPNDFLRSHYQSITNATSVGQNGGALGLSANEIKRQAAEAGAHDMVKMIEGMELLKQGINDYAKQVIKGKDTDTVIQQKRKDFIKHVTNFSNETRLEWGSDPAWTHFDKFLAKSNHPRAAEMRKGFHSWLVAIELEFNLKRNPKFDMDRYLSYFKPGTCTNYRVLKYITDNNITIPPVDESTLIPYEEYEKIVAKYG